jgi:hypothetical protein
MAATDTVTGVSTSTSSRRSLLENGWTIALFGLVILLVLGWRFLADPSLSAPTRDPAWYTWRAQVVMDGNPGSIAGEWGPIVNNSGLFSGGYRVTTLVAGALLQRVAGIDRYSFSAFLMLGIPVLTGLAFGAGAFRSRRDALVVLLTMLATAALFLTTPYVGYLDNITVLFLLALTFPFLGAARTSWGARSALLLIGIAAAFTHPTTCVLFGLTMMAVFGFHFVTSRFRLGEALKSDGPALMSVGFGMILGLACWVIGIWGQTAAIADAALPPPYTKKFFVERLGGWVMSMQPLITGPLIVIAIVSTIWMSRRERKPADAFDVHAAWWLLPFAFVFSFVLGSDYQIAGAPGSPVVPYYRFMNASAAPMALVGLGAFVAVRWLWRGKGLRLAAGALAALVVVGSLGWMFIYGTRASNWVSDKTQWADQAVRTSLAAVNDVVAHAGARPNVLVMNYNNTDDETRTNSAYGWGKTYTNVFRTGLPGDAAQYSVTYLGTIQNFLADQVSQSASQGYNTAARQHFEAMQSRFRQFPAAPVAFVIGQYYKGLCNDGACQNASEDQVFQQALQAGNAQEIGPDVYVLTGPGLYTPPASVIAQAKADAKAVGAQLTNPPSAWSNPLHTLRVLFGLFVLVILPGLLAMRFFEIDESPVTKVALVPGISFVLTILTGIAVLAVWRGPLTTTKGWVVAALAVALGGVLGLAKDRIVAPLESFGNFFNGMFAAFSNRDFSVLMGVQFLAQAGQGVVQGAIAKSLAFGGQKGFDVQNLPSARYLLVVVLCLYGPYTIISPFIGVFIDRFPRRRVVWWANIATAVLVGAVAFTVLVPLGKGTTEGSVFKTAGLIVGLLAVQACVRVALAVKSAAIPDVLAGKDLLQGNGLSQAGGALLQIVGIAFGTVLAGFAPPWIAVVIGAGVLVAAALVTMQMRHAEAHVHGATFAQEAGQVVRNIVAGVKEVVGRPPAALGLSSFQMLRYQFWGFGLFVFGLYGKNLVQGGSGKADTLSLVLSGLGGLLGGGLGMVVAQKYKDKVAPVRLLMLSMVLLGIGTVIGGLLVSVPGFAVMLFLGFFAFFVGKISTDTITQQSMPDDFRGRAFALFDIAYNLGYIVPALILYLLWVENSPATTRTILLVSGAVFLGLTALIGGWAKRIADQFAPQDDLIGEEAAELASIE